MLWLLWLALVASPLANGQHRIVSLTSPATETLYTLGAQAQLVGVTDVCVFPDQVREDKKTGRLRVVGYFKDVDFSLVESLQPDLIFTSTSFQRDLALAFEAKGYHVLHYEPKSLEEVFLSIEQIGAAVGKEARAKRLTSKFRAELRDIQAKSGQLTPVRVYLEVNHVGPWTTGRNSPLNDLIRAAGGVNIFEDDPRGVFRTRNEEISRRNPDVILSPIWLEAKMGGIDGITTIAEIISRPGFRRLQAVRDSRVLYYDSALLKHVGPRQILAIRKLAHLLHPNEFSAPPGTIPWELGRIR